MNNTLVPSRSRVCVIGMPASVDSTLKTAGKRKRQLSMNTCSWLQIAAVLREVPNAVFANKYIRKLIVERLTRAEEGTGTPRGLADNREEWYTQLNDMFCLSKHPDSKSKSVSASNLKTLLSNQPDSTPEHFCAGVVTSSWLVCKGKINKFTRAETFPHNEHSVDELAPVRARALQFACWTDMHDAVMTVISKRNCKTVDDLYSCTVDAVSCFLDVCVQQGTDPSEKIVNNKLTAATGKEYVDELDAQILEVVAIDGRSADVSRTESLPVTLNVVPLRTEDNGPIQSTGTHTQLKEETQTEKKPVVPSRNVSKTESLPVSLNVVPLRTEDNSIQSTGTHTQLKEETQTEKKPVVPSRNTRKTINVTEIHSLLVPRNTAPRSDSKRKSMFELLQSVHN